VIFPSRNTLLLRGIFFGRIVPIRIQVLPLPRRLCCRVGDHPWRAEAIGVNEIESTNPIRHRQWHISQVHILFRERRSTRGHLTDQMALAIAAVV